MSLWERLKAYVDPAHEARSRGGREAVGVRLHACRGRLTLGPDRDVVQSTDEVVRHCDALAAEYHDPKPGARRRVAFAPCGVHVEELGLFDELATLAEDHDGVRLHTHLYKKVDAVAARDRYATTPWRPLGASRVLVVHLSVSRSEASERRPFDVEPRRRQPRTQTTPSIGNATSRTYAQCHRFRYAAGLQRR